MQPTDAIHTGDAANYVRVVCNGSTLTLYVNGQQVDSVTDTTFTEGDVGLIAGTFDSPDVEIAFDNFVVTPP